MPLEVNAIEPFLKKIIGHADTAQDEKDRIQSLLHQISVHKPQNIDILERLKKIFKNRWHLIKDTSADYLVSNNELNQLWLQLACELDAHCHNQFIYSLFPQYNEPISSKNNQILKNRNDLTHYLLSEDGEILYHLNTIFNGSQEEGDTRELSGDPLCLLKPKSSDYRALSLQELYCIRLKKTDMDNHFFENPLKPWRILKKFIFPSFAQRGKLVHQNLLGLKECIECFYKTDDDNRYKVFFRALKAWSFDMIRNEQVADVNHLYGQLVPVGDCSYFLIDLILDCLYVFNEPKNEKELKKVLESIGCWLVVQDPLFMMTNAINSDEYSALCTKFWSLNRYLDEVEKSSYEISSDLKLLMDCLRTTPIVMKDVVKLYTSRWQRIKDTENDYLAAPVDTFNLPWIVIAKILHVDGEWKKDPYQLLIPSIIHANDNITKEPISTYPLELYILSDDGHQLILLLHSEKLYKSQGLFYKHTHTGISVPFTQTEDKRILRAHPDFSIILEEIRNKPKADTPLDIEVILSIYKLAIGSLYGEGLSSDYDTEQSDAAHLAYKEFLIFYENLNSYQKSILNKTEIVHGGHKKTFEQLLNDILYKNECIAVAGHYLLQFIIDHAPYLKFPKRIYDKFDIDIKREYRTSKEINPCQKDKVQKHLEWLYLSITSEEVMKNQPSSPYQILGRHLSIAVPLIPILDQLKALFESGDEGKVFETYLLIYGELQLSIPKEKKTWANLFDSSQSLNQWLKKALSFCEAKLLTCSALQFFCRIKQAKTSKYFSEKIKTDALNELLSIHLNARTPWMERLFVNQLWQKLLKSITPHGKIEFIKPTKCQSNADEVLSYIKSTILQSMHESQTPYSPDFFKKQNPKVIKYLDRELTLKIELNVLHTFFNQLINHPFFKHSTKEINEFWHSISGKPNDLEMHAALSLHA